MLELQIENIKKNEKNNSKKLFEHSTAKHPTKHLLVNRL